MSKFASLLLLSGLIGAQAQSARQVTFKNSCKKDIWFYPTTGAIGDCSAGCPTGTSCNEANSICYYDNPKPNNGNYRIPAGGNNVVVYPFYDNTAAAVWNGNWGFCEDGMTCNQNATACDSEGCGIASGPYGIAEVNLIKNGSDYYDISNIAGVSIPMSITPDNLPAASANADDPYTCGAPGSVKPNATGLGASTWDFTVPSVEYQWVTAGNGTAKTCSADTDCSSGEACGLVYDSGKFGLTCGTLSGFWTGGAVCAVDGGTTYMNCSASLTNGPYTGTNAAFYGCGDTSGSCYQPGADENCCGCANWQDVFNTTLVPSSTILCNNTSPAWAEIVQPTLQYIKEGCPNCYTFPYDDMSSTFTCKTIVDSYNVQNYTVELFNCPL